MHSRLWLHMVFTVLAVAACGVHDSTGAPGAGGGSPGGAAEPMPAGLRAAYIAAVQRDAPPAYVAEPSRRGAWTVHNDAHRFAADFDAQGISVAPEGGAWHLGLSVARYGCGESLQPVSRVEPEGAGNRIAYRRVDPGSGAAVEEWYVNGPLGLEQGFSIDAPPCAREGTIAIEMALDGLTASPRGEGAAELRDGNGPAALRYTDVHARDAQGHVLPARLSANANGRLLSIHVDAAGASYPVEIDPLVTTEQAVLTASDGHPDDFFGNSVAVSGDGSTAVVGAPGANIGNNFFQGAAYVFVGSGAAWTQAAKLTAPDGMFGDGFGDSVAVSGDGSTVVAGAPGANAKKAYVFVGSGPTWTLRAELTASDGAAGDSFGSSVAVSGDGGTVVAGAPFATVGGNSAQGAAYVFVRSGATWTQAKLTASDGAAGDRFGWSVAVSGDGSTVVAGAPSADVGNNSFQGAAYVFVGSGATWTQKAELTASDGAANDRFGSSVAVSGDGGTAVAGAPFAKVGSNLAQGAAYVFVRSGATWTQAKLTASDGEEGDELGTSVAVSGDGSTVVAGAQFATPFVGAAYVFVGSGAAWTQAARFNASSGFFGSSVAASGDGSTVLVGAPFAGVEGERERGAAHVFVLTRTNGEPCTAAAQCESGFCVDGVCCNSACGGSATDCQACSIAAGAVANGTCGPVRNGTSCDDGNACTTNDTCQSDTCVGGPPLDCSDDNTCTTDSCNPSVGCVHTPAPDGTKCDDGNRCTIDDRCQAGECKPRKVKTCPHGRACNRATGSCSGHGSTVEGDDDD